MRSFNYHVTGSPPLVRERRIKPPMQGPADRITPARAGKTSNEAATTCQGQDHPRSCGKDSSKTNLTLSGVGSPPLVRERHTQMRLYALGAGITPARAGKTAQSLLLSSFTWDHPRSCGKDACKRPWSAPAQGSPPLVRERLRLFVRSRKPLGITPARAGKT